MQRVAVIAGAGPGLGASVAKRFARDGFGVALLARNKDKLDQLRGEIEAARGKAASIVCDLSSEASIQGAVGEVFAAFPGAAVEVVVYNPRFFARGPFLETPVAKVDEAWRVLALGGFVLVQQLLPSMLKAGRGTVIFTGATAAMRGGAQFYPLSMPKFAVRSLAQSLAREFGPRGIHVVHAVIDGMIGQAGDTQGDSRLDPDAIADTLAQVASQPRSAWTHELDLRPLSESF